MDLIIFFNKNLIEIKKYTTKLFYKLHFYSYTLMFNDNRGNIIICND